MGYWKDWCSQCRGLWQGAVLAATVGAVKYPKAPCWGAGATRCLPTLAVSEAEARSALKCQLPNKM